MFSSSSRRAGAGALTVTLTLSHKLAWSDAPEPCSPCSSAAASAASSPASPTRGETDHADGQDGVPPSSSASSACSASSTHTLSITGEPSSTSSSRSRYSDQCFALDGASSPVDAFAWEEQCVLPPAACAYLAGAQAGTGMTPVHRASVVDNMAAAAAALGLDNDSLFTGVACLDRYLAAKPTRLEMLQPTGIACLWLAAKYEQLVVPPAAQFAALMLGHSDGSALAGGPLARKLLVALEADVLATLDYRLAAIVTVKPFKHCIMAALQASKAAAGMSRHALDRLYCMTSYLTEVSLLEYQLLPCPPSQLAAACVAYAHVLLGLHLDASTLLQLSGHNFAELHSVLEFVCALHSTLSAALRLGTPYAVTLRYCRPELCCAAVVPPITSAHDPRLVRPAHAPGAASTVA